MSTKILVLFCLLITVLLITGLADAQQPKKVPRIGILKTGVPSDINIAAFRQGLRDLGYIEGQNVVLEYRWADRDEHLPDLAAELVRLRVDVIVTGASEAFAAKQSTKTIPIVLGNSLAPLKLDWSPASHTLAESLRECPVSLLNYGPNGWS